LASPEILSECVIWGLAGSIGQIFIFLTISLFDCYLLTIITTTRKFFSVVYSNFRFGHNFDNTQWVGASIVMICTFVELFSKKDPKVAGKDKK
jgi:UDP-galactose transporter B1